MTDHTWKLTGETGSLRYMAPEVAADTPYGKMPTVCNDDPAYQQSHICNYPRLLGHSADVYSFGVMLWEMLTTEKPYAGYNKKMHNDIVVVKGGRPQINDKWSPSLVGFLKSCWHQDLTRRPTSAKASIILKREAAKAGSGDEMGLNNFRRKSTFVNRNSRREKHAASVLTQQ